MRVTAGECHEIETYAPLLPELPEQLRRFSEAVSPFLRNPRPLDEYLESMTVVEEPDDTWLQSITPPELTIRCGGRILRAEPSVMLWLPRDCPRLRSPHLGYSLNFSSEELYGDCFRHRPIFGLRKQRHEKAAMSLVWEVMEALYRHLNQCPVFFTDEWFDGKAWFALAAGEGTLWQFLFACLPLAIREGVPLLSEFPLGELHDTYEVREYPDRLVAAHLNAWGDHRSFVS